MADILIADDDDILADLVRFRLEALGHTISVASDGASAVDHAKNQRPDLIILDSMMPVLTGPEVLRALRAEEATAAIPILMLTARKGEEDVVTALKAGANEYMTKPFMPQELAVRVEKLLAGQGDKDA